MLLSLGLSFLPAASAAQTEVATQAPPASYDAPGVEVAEPPGAEASDAPGPHPGLLIPGIAAFAASYVLHAALASPFAGFHHEVYFSGTFDPAWEDIRWLGVIPFAGPWIQLAILPANAAEGWAGWLVADGLVQLVAAVLFGTSFAVGSGRRVAVVPAAGPDFTGLTIGGEL